MSIFEFDDYRNFMRFNIDANKQIRGYKGKMAAAAHCHTSFLSQVLNSHIHLGLDHAARLAAFWHLDEDEADYFLELVHLERAGSPHLKKICERRLKNLNKKRGNLAERFKKPKLSESSASLYYSSWYWSALHVITSIPEYQTIDAIAERLTLPSDFVHESLKKLETLGLVCKENNRWIATQRNIHLPKDSPLIGMHHTNWHIQASLSAHQRIEESIHYASLYALSKRDFETIKRLILDIIDQSRNLVELSSQEEIVCFNCDYFKL